MVATMLLNGCGLWKRLNCSTECLYLLSLIAVAILSSLVQFIGRKNIRAISSFIFSGVEYRYNVLAYLAGTLLFVGYIFLTYKKLVKKHEKNRRVPLAFQAGNDSCIVAILCRYVFLFCNGGIYNSGVWR